MRDDYSSMIWVNDSEGREFVCTVDFEHSNEKEYERLSEKERKSCSNMNQIMETGG